MLGSQCLLMHPDVLPFALQGNVARNLNVTGCAPLLTQTSFLKFHLGCHRKLKGNKNLSERLFSSLLAHL